MSTQRDHPRLGRPPPGAFPGGLPPALDMAAVREVFETSQDFTVGIEEEFAILDPETLALDQRFDELSAAGATDEVLAKSIAAWATQATIRPARAVACSPLVWASQILTSTVPKEW